MSEIQEISKGTKYFQKSKTDLLLQNIVFSWTVSNFPLVFQFPKYAIHSPAFSVIESPFELVLKAASENHDDDSINIQLCKIKKDGKRYYFKHKISFVKSKSDHVCSREDFCSFNDETLLGRTLTFNSKDVKSKNDKLIIQCEISILLQNDLTVDKTVSSAEYRKTQLHLKSVRAKNKFYEESICCILAILACAILYIAAVICSSHSSSNLISFTHQNKINKFIFDSATKLMYIGEVLNMSDIKMNAYDFLNSYCEMLNITNFKTVLPIKNDSS